MSQIDHKFDIVLPQNRIYIMLNVWYYKMGIIYVLKWRPENRPLFVVSC